MKSIASIAVTAIAAVCAFCLTTPPAAEPPLIRRFTPHPTMFPEQVDPVLDFVVSEVISEGVPYPVQSVTIRP